MKFLLVISSAVLLLSLFGCSGNEQYEVEYYRPAFRQSGPEPVYSRVMWSHLPDPIRPQAAEQAPVMMPVISFEFPDSTLEETVEALAQTMGYRWHYPQHLGKRVIQINMEGTIDEILKEIGRQAKVETMLDHELRLVRVIEKRTLPQLPQT